MSGFDIGTLTRQVSHGDRELVTLPVLHALVAEWKLALGLEDWRFCVTIVPKGDMDDNLADVTKSASRKHATIRMLRPEDFDEDLYGWASHDMEETVVHELLHCVMWWSTNKPGTVPMALEEQTIDSLARLLVAQAREIRRLLRERLSSTEASGPLRTRQEHLARDGQDPGSGDRHRAREGPGSSAPASSCARRFE